MNTLLKSMRRAATALILAIGLAAAAPGSPAIAQTPSPSVPATAAPSQATISALQEALNKQGIAVKVDGALNDDTRSAIRKYQSQHHLPVTGEPDKATLDKLGVVDRQSAAPTEAQPPGQTIPSGSMQMGQMPMGQMPMGQMQAGSMMHCRMMQGQMQGMMLMMQGMTQMMQAMHTMHGQSSPGQAPGMGPGQMQPKQN